VDNTAVEAGFSEDKENKGGKEILKEGPFKFDDWFSEVYEPSREMTENVLMKYRRLAVVDLTEYSIVRIYSSGVPAEKSKMYTLSGIYPDAKFGFVLQKNGAPIASIWFDVLENRVLVIKQIQGKRGCREALAGFRWERMLVRFVVEWTGLHNFKEVRVIRGEHQEWHRNIPERKKKFYLIYDVSAKREGFKPVLGKGIEYYSFIFGGNEKRK